MAATSISRSWFGLDNVGIQHEKELTPSLGLVMLARYNMACSRYKESSDDS